MIPRQPHILQVPTPAEPGQDLEDEEISKIITSHTREVFFWETKHENTAQYISKKAQ